jgi:hypothetical protein
VFETAASLFIEEESGTYTARSRHPHNGYYAGDFSQTSWSGSERRPSPVTVIPAAWTRSPHAHPVRPLPAS